MAFDRIPRIPLGLWMAALALAMPAAARAQDADVDAIPDPEPALDGPRDPLDLGLKKLAYAFSLKSAGVYDDNIFLSSRDETSDTISVVLLTTKLRYDHGAGTAGLSYRARDRQFARHDEFNGLEHLLDGSASLETSRVRFETGFEWRALKDPFDVLESGERVDTAFDREFLKATADFGRFDLELAAALARFTVDDEALDRGDYRRWEVTVTSVVESWPQVSLLGEVGLRGTRYDEETFSDFTVLSVAAGARGSLTPKTRVEARVGYAHAEPRGESLVAAEEFSGLVAEIATTWQAGEKHELKLDLRREPVESLQTGLAVADEIRLGYKFTPDEKLSFQGQLSWDHRRESDGSGDRRGVLARVGAQWSLPSGIHVDVGTLFRMRETADSDSDYENLRISLGIGVQW